jgi:hypothetical protein
MMTRIRTVRTLTLATTLALVVVTLFSLLPAQHGARPISAENLAQRNGEVEPTISVSGEGEVRAEPDIAVVRVGVTHLAPESDQAMAEVSRRLAAVIASVKGLGLEDRDVQTSGLSLQPVYRRQRSGEDLEIEGYRATNNVSLIVRDLGRASSVLDAALNSGANQMHGVSFSIEDTEPLKLRALAAATVNARSKADAMAAAAGVTISGIASLSEESVSVPRPMADAMSGLRAAPAAEAVAPPVEGGEMTIRARVRASFRM